MVEKQGDEQGIRENKQNYRKRDGKKMQVDNQTGKGKNVATAV